MRRFFICLCLGGLAACDWGATDPAPALVAFKYDAPFCGSGLIEKSIDGAVVSTDSMLSGTTSKYFPLTTGSHVLGARRLLTTNGQTSTIYRWPDTTVAPTPGVAITRVLSLYCS